MIEHRYTLEPYKGKNTRFQCPSCEKKHVFTRYVDTLTGQHINPNVGRCNRESNCGYHYTPKQYFLVNPVTLNGQEKGAFFIPKSFIKEPATPSFIDVELFNASLKGYGANNFVKYLIGLVGEEVALQLVIKYRIGTSRHWNGSTVFWQIDIDGKIRTGKIMQYDAVTGKRVKEPFNHIYWVHKAIKQPDFKIKQCLFGEHLLAERTKPVAIVESEKTAIIASVYLPNFIWLAVGGLSNLNYAICSVLKGRDVFLFPDLNGYEKWNVKSKELSIITKFTVSDLLERKATVSERKQGLDLADFLIRVNYQQFLVNET